MLLAVGAQVMNAGTIAGSVSPIDTGSNVDLTVLGKSDWVHWGLYTSSSINRKGNVPSQLSDFTTFGADPGAVVPAYQYADNFNGYTWEDGSPVVSVTDTTTGVYCIQDYPWIPLFPPTGFGFRFTAPADTTWRTLQVFVGAYAAVGKLQATLSDGGPSYTDTSLTNIANGPGVVYTLNYKADSPGQTLTIDWTLAARAGTDTDKANVTLQAAALSVTNANNPPWVTLTDPPPQSEFAAPATITLAASAQDFDGTVTNVAFYVGTNKLSQSAGAPYSFTWNNPPIGHYLLTALATDNGGAKRSSTPVEVFVYGTGGTLNGTVAAPAQALDLTIEGTSDWTHWGLSTNSSFDYKLGVLRQISDFTPLGTNAVQRYTDNFTAFSWTNGTPTLSCTGTTTGVFITGVTNGFSLTAPADTNARTLRVYIGCFAAEGNFEAYLSDLSARPYIDSSVSSYGNDYAVYTLAYTAASAGQHLNIVYQTSTLFDCDFGNVSLQSATLEGQIAASPPGPVQLLQPKMLGSDFIFSFSTESNHTYAVQFEDSLSASNWVTITNLVGTGQSVTVTNQTDGAQQKFYRVQTQ
jgi:hypothetical protein